ncbi:unnamed protein product [Coregonus sp. 'balchen']|nr:unnamed protein product [Coregonus sp. 'balchen']
MFKNEAECEYSAGEVLSGHVVVDVSVQVKAIKIASREFAHVCWVEGHDEEHHPLVLLDRTHLRVFRRRWNSSEYLNLSKQQQYVFCWPLVNSFNGKYGSVCYEVTVVLQKLLTQTVNKEFSISHIDVTFPWLLLRESIPINAVIENCCS